MTLLNISLQDLCAISGAFTVPITAILLFFLLKAYKHKSEAPVPSSLIPSTSGIVFLIIMILTFIINSTGKTCTGPHTGNLITIDKLSIYLDKIGAENSRNILHIVEKKLIEIDTLSIDYDDKDLVLFEKAVVQVIYSNRKDASKMGFELASGDKLCDLLIELYPEEMIIADIRSLAKEIFNSDFSKEEKLRAVEAYIEKRQFELSREIIKRGFKP